MHSHMHMHMRLTSDSGQAALGQSDAPICTSLSLSLSLSLTQSLTLTLTLTLSLTHYGCVRPYSISKGTIRQYGRAIFSGDAGPNGAFIGGRNSRNATRRRRRRTFLAELLEDRPRTVWMD